MIGRIIDRYRITARLGQGGMGSVWKAEDTLLGRTVALKILSEALTASGDHRRRFLREAQAAAQLDHPGIATVFEFKESEALCYIACQLVDGETVLERIRRGLPSPAEAVRIAADAAGALAHAHEHGVLHRDVTSRNIMLSGAGKVVIVDFGLALPEGLTRVTREGSTMGTLPYMAPELLRGQEGDHRADLYGLGVVLFEMLTGRLPFKGAHPSALMYAAVHEPPPPASRIRPGLPDSVDGLVGRALQKQPGRRFPSAREMAGALRGISRHEIANAGAPPPPAENGSEDRETLSRAPTGADPGARVPHATGSEGLSGREGRGTSSREGPLAEHPGPPGGGTRLPSAISPGRAPALLAAAAVLAVAGWLVWSWIAPPPASYASVAVLPFQNSSASPAESDHLIEGLGEALSTRLISLAGIKVRPWVSSRIFPADGDLSPPEIARALRVEAVILGTFRRDGRRLSGSASLVEASSGLQVWATEFDEPAGDLMAVQGRIALRVASHLRGELTGEETARLEERVSSSGEAYDAYLRGSSLLSEGARETADQALQYFERAVELDPELARAHVGVGAVHSDRFFYGWGGGALSLELAEGAYRRALEIDPEHLDALRGLMRVAWESNRGEECLRLGERVRRLGREDAGGYLARGEAYFMGGLTAKAVEMLRASIDMDPVNPGAHWFLVPALALDGRFEEALEAGEEFLARFGEDPEVYLWMGFALQGLGEAEEALLDYERANDLYGENSVIYIFDHLGSLRLQMGDEEAAREAFRRGLEMVDERLTAWPDNFRMRGFRAVFLSGLGRHEAVIREVDSQLEADPERMTQYAFPLARAALAAGEEELALEVVRRTMATRGFHLLLRDVMAGVDERYGQLLSFLDDRGVLAAIEGIEADLRAAY